MNQRSNIALEKVKTLLERIPFYETQIQAFVAQKQLSEAIQLGINTLKQLGASFPERPQPDDFPDEIAKISSSVANRTIEELINLPAIIDPQGLSILRLLLRLSSVLVMAAPQLMPFCISRAVKLSIVSGNSALSAPAYVTYGMNVLQLCLLWHGLNLTETSNACE